jgi:hypothetical protein
VVWAVALIREVSHCTLPPPVSTAPRRQHPSRKQKKQQQKVNIKGSLALLCTRKANVYSFSNGIRKTQNKVLRTVTGRAKTIEAPPTMIMRVPSEILNVSTCIE